MRIPPTCLVSVDFFLSLFVSVLCTFGGECVEICLFVTVETAGLENTACVELNACRWLLEFVECVNPAYNCQV